MMLFASAGVLVYSGLKVPYFAFFAEDSGKRPQEAPMNMLIAMALAAALCIGIGVWPSALFAILPFDVDYTPYTDSHVLSQVQLLVFSGLAFVVLLRSGLYPKQQRSINLDTDWFYLRLGRCFLQFAARVAESMHSDAYDLVVRLSLIHI